MSWTQPCCEDCWVVREGARRPNRVTTEHRFVGVQCCFCGRITHSGIYVRVDPRSVPYPGEERSD
jgi:hypothetical protein